MSRVEAFLTLRKTMLQKSNNRGVTTVALTDGVIVPGENVQIITLVAAEANFMLQVGEDAYLYAASNSSYMNTVGYTEAESLLSGSSGPRRSVSDPWDWWNDGDNAIGEVPDPVPVGDTPWVLMLLLAAGYIAFVSLRKFRYKIHDFVSAPMYGGAEDKACCAVKDDSAKIPAVNDQANGDHEDGYTQTKDQVVEPRHILLV